MTLRFILILVSFLVASAISDYSGTSDFKIYQETKPIISNNKAVGLESVAGIISRNGRVSSLGGIKIFPLKPMTLTEDEIYPLTVSTQKDGKYTSGSVQVHPGFASVTARAGYAPNQNELLFNDLFIKPEIFATRNLEPWIFKDLFMNIAPPKPYAVKNTWLYPSFNPFMNYWR